MNKSRPEVTVLGKPGCHLCEAVEQELRSLEGLASRLNFVNIDTNRMLYDKYQLRIPIVTLDGKVVFEASMMDPEGKWKAELSQLLGSHTS